MSSEKRKKFSWPSIYQIWKGSAYDELEGRYFEAIYQSHAEIVADCLMKGVNPNATDDDGLTGLHHAAIRGDMAMGRVLLQSKKIDINKKDSEKGITALMYSCIYGQLKFCKELLYRGANPNLISDKQRSALHMACTRNYLKIVLALISKGARVNVRDVFDNSPLSIAMIERGALPITKLLLRKGANATVVRQFPLFLDCILNCNTEHRLKTIELLLLYDVDLHCLHPMSKRNCLHYAGLTGYLPVAKLLLPLVKSNLDQRDYTNRTPIEIAWDHRNMEVFHYYFQFQEHKLLVAMIKQEVILGIVRFLESELSESSS